MQAAHARFYSTALIIPPTVSRKAYRQDGFEVVPCPAQFHQPNGQRQTTCEHCNLCSDTYRNWARRRVVGFQPDGRSGPEVLSGRLPFEE